MTAVSGADRPDGMPARADSSAERSAAAPRSLERIFPRQTDAVRARQMQDAWAAFFDQRGVATSGVLKGGGRPAEIAHALTEMVHEWFCASGVTLTCYETPRLVIELLELHGRARRASQESSPEAPAPSVDDPSVAAGPLVPEANFEASPATLVGQPIQESDVPPATPAAAAEEAGPQDPVGRLWADRSIDAILVDGPRAIFVERNGAIELSGEAFRDDVHLGEIAAGLVRHSTPAGQPVSAIADFQMDDGAVGTVIFPPAAPRGPIIAVHRDEAAVMTFERLVARDAMSQAMADLLCLAVRGRLNILISGPALATAGWLGAVGRALGGAARIVSVARARDFPWAAPGGVELVVPASPESGVHYPSLIAAGARLRPDLLLLKEIRTDDMPALLGRLSHGDRGIAASMMPGPVARSLEPLFDLSLRLDRGADGACRALVLQDAAGAAVFVHDQGQFVRRAGTPAFGGALRAAGYSAALSTILS